MDRVARVLRSAAHCPRQATALKPLTQFGLHQNLTVLVASWPGLPLHIRQKIMLLARSSLSDGR